MLGLQREKATIVFSQKTTVQLIPQPLIGVTVGVFAIEIE